jgi:hypothetical protein
MKRASDAAWREALQPSPKPSTKAPRTKRAGAGGAEQKRVQLGTSIPPELLQELHRLAARLYLKQGRRVTIADLVTEAVTDLLRKHSR